MKPGDYVTSDFYGWSGVVISATAKRISTRFFGAELYGSHKIETVHLATTDELARYGIER